MGSARLAIRCGLRPRSRYLALLAALALLAGPAAAVAPAANADAVASSVRALRDAAGQDSLGALLSAVDGHTPGQPRHTMRTPAPRVAAEIPSAVHDLLAEVLRADAYVATAVAPRHRATVAATVRDMNRGSLRAVVTGTDGATTLHPRVAAAADMVDLAAMTRTAASLGAAIDRFLDAPAPKATVAGSPTAACDVAEVPGVLCVGGQGTNEHRTHYRLTIDLGGNDIYSGATAAGGCVSDTPADSSCVAVSIDLGGDDRYVPAGRLSVCEAAGFGPRGGICGQGSGIVGVGMLVDAAGNDVYEARTESAGGDCLGGQFTICGVTTAQGTGRFGVGVLADLAGNDAYNLISPIPAANDPAGDRSFTVDGQGNGVAGVGVLFDGGGNDSYLTTGPATGYLGDGTSATGWSTYNAQGASVGGVGVIVEYGGADSYRMTVRPGDGAEHRVTKSEWGEGGAVNRSGGQGFGLGVSGLPNLGGIITGPGNTTYDIDLAGRFTAEAVGQGMGSGGVLDDAGGDDVYRMSASTDATLRRTCPGCDLSAGGANDTITNGRLGAVYAQGQGVDGGRLHDAGGGHDTYTVAATAAVTVLASDGAAAVHRLASPKVFGQGAAGRLFDEDGSDRYTLAAHHRVRAVGQSAGEALAGGLTVQGQGGGGALIDLGGRDRYVATATSDVQAQPSTGVSADAGFLTVDVQGLGGQGSMLVDRDEGEADVFQADAPGMFSTCNGSYATSPGWTGGRRSTLGATNSDSCSSTGGGAAVTSAAAPAAPAALTAAATRDDAAKTTRVTVRLADSAGQPLGGRRVRVSPELRLGAPYYGVGPTFVWQPWDTSLELVTDASGLASGEVRHPSCPQVGTPCDPPRLRASFFGDFTAGAATTTTSGS